MSIIRKIELKDFEETCNLVQQGLPSWGISNEQRFRMFNNYWNIPNHFAGYVAEVDNKIVGYIGTICSEISKDNQIEKICNLTSWYLKEEYRNHGIGLKLLMPIIGMKSYTITNLSPTKDAYKLLKNLGFKDLETGHYLLFPFLKIRSIFRNKCELITNHDRIKTFLTEKETKIFNDHIHSDFDCKHIVITRKDEKHLYLIISRLNMKRLKLTKFNFFFGKISYINDISIFKSWNVFFRNKLCWFMKVPFIAIDKRFLGVHKPYLSIHKKLNVPLVYKSKKLKEFEITELYSEFFTLSPWR